MNKLERRVIAMEGARPADDGWRPVLDAMPFDELERLEGLLMRLEAGETEQDLTADELRFFERIGAMAPNARG